MANDPPKRIILPSFEYPAELIGDIIHVAIMGNKDASAKIEIVSAAEFQYKGSSQTQVEVDMDHVAGAGMGYARLVDKLVRENEGVVNPTRLIEDGLIAHIRLSALREGVQKLAKKRFY